ncbi:MAG: NAD(P)-binding domain-containing protein [Myxococcales bacterium]|nr:NAD(P)-binding domain-containing protein [Myxococcales bacterium]
MHLTVFLTIALAAAALLVLGALYDDRRARRRRYHTVVAPRIELPLLHSINDDRCIGCEACVAVCPTNVLDLVNHKVVVSRFSDCVQCEQCANKCPTTALVMYRQGQQPTTLTVPELDEHFQTGVPGQYLIGEVAGKPLVKNAANLGRAVVEHIAATFAAAGAAAAAADHDVVIVGSGPAGLSAGLTCLVRGLRCVVLEKEHIISATVARYPKGKHFMAEPSMAPNLSYLPVFDASKEALVAAWQQVVEAVNLPIRRGEAVESVKRGDDGILTVKTTVATYRARAVILATGLRGKPRLLAVPGANLEKVQSRLDDPDEFGGQHVLVVGGGDSALEAATSLVDAGATVTLSYRGDGWSRAKQANQARVAKLSSEGRLSVLLKSNVASFTPDAVTIKLADGSTSTVPNQQAFVLIGADTPVTWLEGLGVRFVERPHLYALGSTEGVVERISPTATQCPRDPAQAIAQILGRPVPRPAKPGRLRTVVGEVVHKVDQVAHDVWHEVGTSVTAAPVLDGARHRRAGSRAELDWTEDSVVAAIDRLGDFAPEPTQAERPRRPRTARAVRDVTMQVPRRTEDSVMAVLHAPGRDRTGSVPRIDRDGTGSVPRMIATRERSASMARAVPSRDRSAPVQRLEPGAVRALPLAPPPAAPAPAAEFDDGPTTVGWTAEQRR